MPDEKAFSAKAFQDPALAARLVEKIRELADAPLRVMEVCGTHTMSLFEHGIRSLLPPEVTLLSGPGCPVCVTSQGEIDAFLSLAAREGLIAAVFGDLIRVPGASTSLAEQRARGADVRIVYSPLDALGLARKNPDREVVFFGVGFETTAPAIAGTILAARAAQLANFSVFCAMKRVIPALFALLDDPATAIDAFLCPGHVSVIIGADAYLPVAEKYRVPCVVAGFEAVDILQGLAMIMDQVRSGRAGVENAYARAVTAEGNPKARELIERVFRVSDAVWRGIGPIPESGYAIRDRHFSFDARVRFSLAAEEAPEPPGCRCGDVLKGLIDPTQCPLFAKACKPERPVGPCMVSGEGSCAAHYKYGDRRA